MPRWSGATVSLGRTCRQILPGLLATLTCLLAVLSPSITVAAQATTFPLHIAGGGAYLADAAGKPFMIVGDSAWSLIASLSPEDARFYIRDRKARGFNTILVSLVEHKFTTGAPLNSYGDPPFLRSGDFSAPNELYFRRAEQIVDLASKEGMLVLLAPAYLGADGGDEGWYQDMKAAGASVLGGYGRYVGARFRKYTNVIWVQGGDYDPPDKQLVTAIAEGIQAADPTALQTVHTNRDTRSEIYWQGSTWLSIDTVYTYDDVARAVLSRSKAGPSRLFFLIEAGYEGERDITYLDTQKSAYSALLSGASGQVFGNNPVWHFDGVGIYRTSSSWRQALASDGANSETHLAALFSGIPWWKLQPDEGRLLKSADAAGSSFAIASRAGDGSLALVYVRDMTNVHLDVAALSPGGKRLRWFDPSSGEYCDISDSGPEIRTPSYPNSMGTADWILVITNKPDG